MGPTGLEPSQKRQKTTEEMLPEAAFIEKHGETGVFLVRCPEDGSNEKWALTGQVRAISDADSRHFNAISTPF